MTEYIFYIFENGYIVVTHLCPVFHHNNFVIDKISIVVVRSSRAINSRPKSLFKLTKHSVCSMDFKRVVFAPLDSSDPGWGGWDDQRRRKKVLFEWTTWRSLFSDNLCFLLETASVDEWKMFLLIRVNDLILGIYLFSVHKHPQNSSKVFKER